jgi:hypothetical protein
MNWSYPRAMMSGLADHGPVHEAQRPHQLRPVAVGEDGVLPLPPRGLVRGDHDHQGRPQRPGFAQEVEVARVQDVEDPGRKHQRPLEVAVRFHDHQ